MNDNDLIKALYAEGLTVESIADKFDIRPIDVRKVLGITIDPRPKGTWKRFFEVLGEDEYPVSRAAQKMGISRETMYAYMIRFERRGHAKSRLLSKTCRVFRMVNPGGPHEPGSQLASVGCYLRRNYRHCLDWGWQVSKEIDRYRDNLLALESAVKSAGLGSMLDLLDRPAGEVLKMLAVSGVDLSAKCLRPVGEPE